MHGTGQLRVSISSRNAATMPSGSPASLRRKTTIELCMGGASFIATTDSVPAAASRGTAVAGRDPPPHAPLRHLLGGLDRVELHQSAELDAGGEKRPLGDLVIARRAVEHDELLGSDIRHRHMAALGERMIRSADEDEVLGVKRTQLQVGVADGSAES